MIRSARVQVLAEILATIQRLDQSVQRLDQRVNALEQHHTGEFRTYTLVQLPPKNTSRQTATRTATATSTSRREVPTTTPCSNRRLAWSRARSHKPMTPQQPMMKVNSMFHRLFILVELRCFSRW